MGKTFPWISRHPSCPALNLWLDSNSYKELLSAFLQWQTPPFPFKVNKVLEPAPVNFHQEHDPFHFTGWSINITDEISNG